MFRSPSAAILVCLCTLVAWAAQARDVSSKQLGRSATEDEIAAWNIDVRPDGHGLRKGSGSVQQGQALYDEKCALCHGTFGESSEYLPIAGGVGTLGTDSPIRTTGSKLNYATTLWDYIYRAMPFQAPKSLTVDEVYALTAYTLHLNDILPADAMLDEKSILSVKMPNAAGFTQEHGFMHRDGSPDVRNRACMKDCVAHVAITSQLPDHVRGAHGDLAQQVRFIGPYRGVPTVAGPTESKGAPSETTPSASSVPALLESSGCRACHRDEGRLIGPSFREIAARYRGEAGAAAELATKIREGGVGAWGSMPMPPHPQLKDENVVKIVEWLLDPEHTP